VRRLEHHEVGEAVAVCSRAFWPDPLLGFFARDLLHEYRYLPEFFEVDLKSMWKYCDPTVADFQGRIGAVAVWVPAEASERPFLEEAFKQIRSLPTLLRAKHKVKAMKLLTAVETARPKHHQYLALLATDPSAQGKGLASGLLRPVLERCDAEGIPSYLETQKEANLAFYGRHGYEQTGVVELSGCPKVWLLTRQPKAE
jgi:GNAT superfamily N-acetyltransferase